MKPAPVPASASDAYHRLFEAPVAHRGLWSPKGAPENSLAAFRLAADAGYGIELDVRLSADAVPMVFHDGGLERMIGRQGRLSDHTAVELSAMRLRDSRDPIPRLSEVLDCIGGTVILHIEIKSRPGQEGPLDEAVAALTDHYPGPFAIIGFNPASHAWWGRNRPGVLRGLDCLEAEDVEPNVAIANPHFLALEKGVVPSSTAVVAREQGFPIVAWTVRSDAEAIRTEPFVDNIIFEGYRP